MFMYVYTCLCVCTSLCKHGHVSELVVVVVAAAAAAAVMFTVFYRLAVLWLLGSLLSLPPTSSQGHRDYRHLKYCVQLLPGSRSQTQVSRLLHSKGFYPLSHVLSYPNHVGPSTHGMLHPLPSS